MFKRILKVVGFVLLGFVVLIGAVVGFMAIRGDFKKKVVKPTAIKFSISKTDLLFDASLIGKESLSNEQIFSFTINAEPYDVTETECIITLTEGKGLIKFQQWRDGGWEDYNSNKFYFNVPIYFKLEDVTDENVDTYYDGIVEMVVVDKSTLLNDKIQLEIDRAITSVSIKDIYNQRNNEIINGLFRYEIVEEDDETQEKYNGTQVQKLNAVVNQDYPLEIITAPLKSERPLNHKEPKVQELYYMDEVGQQYPLIVIDDNDDTNQFKTVKLGISNETTGEIEPKFDCGFLKYDSVGNHFILNSQNSGEYRFVIATYPTYAIQEEIVNMDISFVDKLQLEQILTKNVVIAVSGTDAGSIEFVDTDLEDIINLNLFTDNVFIANSDMSAEYSNLGLTLKTGEEGAEISGRYNELKFLSENDFAQNLNWIIKSYKLKDSSEEDTSINRDYNNTPLTISFGINKNGQRVANISGFPVINNSLIYNVELSKDYTLKLTGLETVEGLGDTITTVISFKLKEQVGDSSILVLADNPEISVTRETADKDGKIITPADEKDVWDDIKASWSSGATVPEYYLELQRTSSVLIKQPIVDGGEIVGYNFKTLKNGLYLTVLNPDGKLINSGFETFIEHDGAESIINIKPIDKNLGEGLKLYAIVVNTDGSMYFTNIPKILNVQAEEKEIIVSNNGMLNLPIIVDEEGLDYSTHFDVEDLASVDAGGSYNQVLMFAPFSTLLTMSIAPTEWGKGLIAYEDAECTDLIEPEDVYSEGTYWVKNNYAMIDYIYFENAGVKYCLLGEIVDGQFNNIVKATGPNFYTKIYPVVAKTDWNLLQGRLETSVEYITKLLTNTATADVLFNGESCSIKYSLSLNEGTAIIKNPTAFAKTFAEYNLNKTYYKNNNGAFEEAKPTQTEIQDWNNKKKDYYEKFDYVKANTICTKEDKKPLAYYKLTGNELEKVAYTGEYSSWLDSNEFKTNFDSYYIIVDHYEVVETEIDGNNTIIKADIYTIGYNYNSIKLDCSDNENTHFSVLTDTVNTARSSRFNMLNNVKFSETKVINVASYYDFENANSTKPKASIGGTYFEGSNGMVVGDNYNIIAGHTNINLDWNGEMVGDKIEDMVAKTSIYINHNYNFAVLRDIFSKLSIVAKEYDSNDNMVGILTNAPDSTMYIKDITYGFIPATNKYNPNVTYYNYNQGVATLVVITEEIINNWTNVYTDYRVCEISAEYQVNNTLPSGHYVRFEWKYSPDNVEPYSVLSPKLFTLSRETTGYGVNAGEAYQLSQLTSNPNADTEFYEIKDGELSKVTYVDGTTYVGEGVTTKYYAILKDEIYTDEIKFLIKIGFDVIDSKYTYTAYAVDKYGNYLVYNAGTREIPNYQIISKNANDALKLKSVGGWIEPNPFYAIYPEFNISDNDKLRFDDENNISFAQVTNTDINNGFMDVKFTNKVESKANKTISVKIVQEGFIDNKPLETDTINKTEMKISLSNLYKYTYKDEEGNAQENNISSLLNISINPSKFSVISMGADVTKNYEVRAVVNGTIPGYSNAYIIISKTETNNTNYLAMVGSVGTTWEVVRAGYDKVTLTLNVTNVIGNYEIECSFANPYNIERGDNATTVIYSGTVFVLAEPSDGDLIDALYNFTTSGSTIKIKYKPVGANVYVQANGTDAVITNSPTYEGLWAFVVPDVDAPTKYVFDLFYGDNTKSIDSFELEIHPNILIKNKVDELIKLDDLYNTTYNFNALEISKYKTDVGPYTKYNSLNLEKLTDTAINGLIYNIYTYTDSEFTNLYTTNVAIETGAVLNVSDIISEVGTYYVKVVIYSGDVQVGQVKFEVTTKSSIVNEQKQNIESIEIVAKENAHEDNNYTLAELTKMFNLSRDGEVYYAKYIKTDNFVTGKTFKWNAEDKVFEPMNTEETAVDKYIKHPEWVDDGATYQLSDGVYTAVATAVDSKQYYQRYMLSDIFWFDYKNNNLQIVYNYGGGKTLTQKVEYIPFTGIFEPGQTYYYLDNGVYAQAGEQLSGVQYYTFSQKLNYNGVDYTFVGTTYNMANRYYNITNDKIDSYTLFTGSSFETGVTYYEVVNGEYVQTLDRIKLTSKEYWTLQTVTGTTVGNNILHYVLNGQSVIYCKQNAYVFETADKIIVLSVENGGKTIYTFDKSAATEDPDILLGELDNLQFNYTGYGKDLANQTYVDSIEYGAEFIFNNKYNIKTNNIYDIYVKPYIANQVKTSVLSGYGYTIDKLFIAKTGMTIEVKPGTGYDISTIDGAKKIIFIANGNKYSVDMPIAVTYDGGLTYSYIAKMIVENNTKVLISYPFNVEESHGETKYNTFNASISEFTKGVDNLYDENDFAGWLGVDTSAQDWESTTRIKYDLALKGDTIDLATDTQLNILRYKAKTIAQNGAVSDSTATISKIELVAVSSTYVNSIANVVDSLALNGNTIQISTSLNFTGYVLFKVYAGDTGAYGYYALKIVDDENFEDVIAFNGARKSATIANKLFIKADPTKVSYAANTYYTASGTLLTETTHTGDFYIANNTIQQFIKNHSRQIYTIAGIDASLIEEDFSNVYLFMINSTGEGADGKAKFDGNETIGNGQLIPNDTKFITSSNMQTLKVAVVVQDNISLVHVCNYELILKVDATVNVVEGSGIAVLDANKEKYSMELEYKYDANNEYNFNSSNYFTISGTKGGQPTKVDFVEGKGNVINQGGSIKYQIGVDDDGKPTYGKGEVATLSGTTLTLTAPVSEEIFFYLTLENGNGFKITLEIKLKPFDFLATNQFEVGNWDSTNSKFDNELDLTKVFGDDYQGDYTINGGGAIKASVTTLYEFTPGNTDRTDTIAITLTDVVPQISKTITVKVKANITTIPGDTYEGIAPTNPLTVDKIDYTGGTLATSGSKLYVAIEDNIVQIQDASKTKTYLTINVGDFESIAFSLTDTNGNILAPEGHEESPYAYFVDGTNVITTKTMQEYVNEEEGYLNFVHLAQAQQLKLIMTVNNSTGHYSNQPVLHITLPKTYTLTPTYRVYGAEFETVTEQQELDLNTENNSDIDKNFFAHVTEGLSYIDDEGNNIVKQARISIDISATTSFTTYTDFVNLGLLQENNPNKLNFSLDNIIGENISTISGGVLTFRSDNNSPTNTLRMKNSSTEITYDFIVRSESNDYSKITYNDELLLVDNTDDNKNKANYIVVSHKQMKNGFDLAYLQYLPTNSDGLMGWIEYSGTDVAGKINTSLVPVVGNTEYSSAIRLKSTELTETTDYTITITPITVNGLENSIKLVVTSFNPEYGYDNIADGYESVYAGTQIGKLTDKDTNKYTRVNNTYTLIKSSAEYNAINVNYIYTKDTNGQYEKVVTKGTWAENKYYYHKGLSEYQVQYVGAVNGLVDHWYLGQDPDYLPDNTSLVYYSSIQKENPTSGIIQARSVASATFVTMIFDVYRDDDVIGRIYYKMLLQNNIKIGINPDLDPNSAVNLYLGSQIYTTADNNKITTATGDDTTVINLLQGTNGTNYNNLFVTLEQYSTNNVISADGSTKALFNGSNDNSALNINNADVINQYLIFDIDNLTGELKDKKNQTIWVNDGKLYIVGNPSGTFTLKVSSTNGTGYGRTFAIRVNRYDNTLARFNDSIDRKAGTGYVSNEEVTLFVDKNKTDTRYAFETYREGYKLEEGKPAIAKIDLLGNADKVSYQINTFDYGTSIEDIKKSSWDKDEITIVKGSDDSYNSETKTHTTDGNGALKINLPDVKFATSGESKNFQYVSVRLTITYNGQPQYYYAHYLVYNQEQMELNDTDKTIKYGDNQWKTDSTITIMGENGMYKWNANIADNEKYKFYALVDGKTEEDCEIKVAPSDIDTENKTLTGKLPDNLFTNSAKVRFVVKATSGGAVLVDDEWTFIAGTTITPKDSKLLREFFLTSEIGNQDYYNVEVIGLIGSLPEGTLSGSDLTNVKSFVNNSATSAKATKKLTNINSSGYDLYEIEYTGTSGSDVCAISATYYVLVGNGGKAMSFNFNGGDYYINATIDDDDIITGQDKAKVVIPNYVKVWESKDGKFVEVTTGTGASAVKVSDSATITSSVSSPFSKNTDNNELYLDGISTLISNKSCTITVEAGGISRTIEVYFNIIINAKKVDSNGYMDANAKLNTVMGDKAVGEVHKVEDYTLKKELLDLIKYNGQNVSTTNETLALYTIEVSKVATSTAYYEVVYTYNNGTTTYTRTLKISTTAA